MRKADPDLRVLADGVRYLPLRSPTLPPATHTNCVFLSDEAGRDVVAVDPGTPWDEERALLAAAADQIAGQGGRIHEVWLTHHHRDHVEAAALLAARTGAAVVAHPRTRDLLAGDPLVDRVATDGARITLGGRAIEVLHTPGHASGHLCLWDGARGVLVAGDMVANGSTIVVEPPDGDMSEYLASLARLEALAPRVLLPAHGEPIAPGTLRLREYTAHRLWREARVLEALRARGGPAGPGDLVARVYDDVPTAIHPLAERSLLAHLLKLARDGRAKPAGAGRFLVT